MITGGVWSEMGQPEQFLSGMMGTYTNLDTYKEKTRLPYCLDEFCTNDDVDQGDYFDDDESVENGFVCQLDTANDDQEDVKETILDELTLESFAPEITGTQLEPSANVRISAKVSPVKSQQKKARNQKVTAQKGKQNQRKKYTLPPVEEPKPEDAPPKRVSKTVIYAVPCGAFKLRSGQTHGKALKPSRILLDQVREQERQRKRGGKQPVANKRAAREIKEPERQELDTEEFETKPSKTDREWNSHDQPCNPDLSRSPSTQHSESSPHMGDLEEHLHANHSSLKSPALRSRLQSNHGMLQPVSEHMLEEHIPQDEHEFDVTEYLNVQLGADTDHSNSSSLQTEVGTDPLLY